MNFAMDQMHDASLIGIYFDWSSSVCELRFAGAPKIGEPFIVRFHGVTELSVPFNHPWGLSISVLDVAINEDGRYEFSMQSGDVIVVVAPTRSFELIPVSNPLSLGCET